MLLCLPAYLALVVRHGRRQTEDTQHVEGFLGSTSCYLIAYLAGLLRWQMMRLSTVVYRSFLNGLGIALTGNYQKLHGFVQKMSYRKRTLTAVDLD